MILFSEKFRELRKNRNFTQGDVAEKIGVTAQAVSKWESRGTYPDVNQLIKLTELFNVSADYLLFGVESNCIEGLEDDCTLRVVLCKGKRVVDANDVNSTIRIRLEGDTNDTKIEVHGNATLSGEIFGDVTARGNVSCDSVGGDVNAGNEVVCDGVNGNITAGDSVKCDAVGGNVTAQGNVNCDNIGGNVSCGMSLDCDNITGNVICKRAISCDNMKGNIESCEGDIHIKELNGVVVKCGKTVYLKEQY